MQENEINEIISEYEELSGGVNPVEVVTPLNVAEEKEKWLDQAKAGSFTNPNFTYDKGLLSKVAAGKSALSNISMKLVSADVSKATPETKMFLKMLTNRVDDAVWTARFAEAILAGSDSEALRASQGKYGELSLQLVQKAKQFVEDKQLGRSHVVLNDETKRHPLLKPEQIKELEKTELDASGIALVFRNTLKEYGLANRWRITIDDKAQTIDVRDRSSLPGNQVIIIPKTKHVSVLKAARLVGHEIECHVLQSENGQQFLRGIGGGGLKTDNETLYEGLAVYGDLSFDLTVTGKADKMPAPWYTIATSEALSKKSFAKVAEKIYAQRVEAGESPEEALTGTWTTVYRIFRGCSNTKNPNGYAFLKDKGYFEGFHIVKPMMRKVGEDWLRTGIFTPDELSVLMLNKKLSPRVAIKSKALSLKVIQDFLEKETTA